MENKIKNTFMRKYLIFKLLSGLFSTLFVLLFFINLFLYSFDEYRVASYALLATLILFLIPLILYIKKNKDIYIDRSNMVNDFHLIKPLIGKSYNDIITSCGNEDSYHSLTNNEGNLETIRTWFGYKYVIIIVFNQSNLVTKIEYEKFL